MTFTAAIPDLRPPTCTTLPNCTQPNNWQLTFLFVGMSFLAIGAGGIRPCNIAFGADQFDTTTKKGKAQLESFFNWWYFSFTVALLIALTGVVYIQTNVSWPLGFAIPASCLLLSIIIFIIGHHTYIIMKPQGSIFIDMARVITAACRKRRLTTSGNSLYDPPLQELPGLTKLPYTDRFKCLDKAAIFADESEIDGKGFPKNNWRLCSLQQVEELKMLIGMAPVWVAGIGFLMAMDLQNSIGILQAIQTNKKIGLFNVPPGWMGLSSMITLSLWILLYERIWVPQSRKLSGKNKRMTMKQRINMGILMSIICPLVAATVEKRRRELALRNGTFESPMSITLLLPQFALSGLLEAFGAVALMEFLATKLPETMRTVSGAIFFLSLSMASYLNSVCVNIIFKITSRKGGTPWLGGQDINKNTLENFYYFVAGLGCLNILYFNLFGHQYVSNQGKATGHRSVPESSNEKEKLETV